MKKTLEKRGKKPKVRKKASEDYSSTEITIQIDLFSSRIVDTIYAALLPETLQPPGFRSRTLVEKKGRVLELRIRADDIVALRAASNSFLRFLEVALRSLQIVAPFYSPASRADLESHQGTF